MARKKVGTDVQLLSRLGNLAVEASDEVLQVVNLPVAPTC